MAKTIDPALAEKLRRGELSAAELARQAAAGIAKTNPTLSAVVEVFEDVVADPLKDGMNPQGTFAGVPFLMKDLGPTLKGRLQEQGSLFMRGNCPTEDAWLTRQMRATLTLSQPERRIGLSAHDFATMAAQPDVLLTRARRQNGAPSNAVSDAADAEALQWDVGEIVELRGRTKPTQLARPVRLASASPAVSPS